MKAGDLEPAVLVVLTSQGAPLNVSTATSVRFIMRAPGASSAVIDAAATKVDDGTVAKRGQVKYVWQSGETATPGTYHAWFEVEWSAGRSQTFPPIGSMTVYIEGDPDAVTP
jgi:hypothetical protein